MAKKVTTVKEAMSILAGAGIKVNEKTHLQVWVFGKQVSKKVIQAGSFLDSIMIPDDKGFKPEWRTKWVHSATCVCMNCSEHMLMSIKKSLPVQKKVAKAKAA